MIQIQYLIEFIKELVVNKFTGTVTICFNQGGVRAIKKTESINIKIK